MKIERKFTTKGTDVFSLVDWDTRQSKITNLDGSTVFQMDDAEVPAGWSQLATDIMVSKYFRKAGVPQPEAGLDPIRATKEGRYERDADGEVITGPERSVKQVVHRLAGCWRAWGDSQGYFDTEEAGQAFYDELAYMMLTQMGAPNSPQWFNTGLNWAYGINGPAQGHWHTDPVKGETRQSEDAYTHPQPHACFIQSIDDDLVGDGGIMDLWVREARLFKYGSGTGTNFSSIRGEGEGLSGGGRSSGLMSFLKIGDRAAGAIKSGGTTRRAAKMVCLDLDHPDVEDFINWKVREEVKVEAMVEGMKQLSDGEQQVAKDLDLHLGYDFNNESYQTVSGQNSNNSVRIPNRFFEALDEDGQWPLIRRTDGEVAKTMPAKHLWDEVGYAAWRCADPGVQYDSTINEWHTCPQSGRINASNPCVTGDTLVATTTGYRRIADLVGQSAEIINGDGTPVHVDQIFRTGRKPTYELTTTAGYRLQLTADHRVKTLNRGDVAASELTVDDQVQLEKPGFGDDFVPESFGELLGSAVGDGCVTSDHKQQFMFLALDERERSVANRLQGNIAECKQWLSTGDRRGTRETQVTSTQTGLRVSTSVEALIEKLKQYAVLDAKASAKRLGDAIFSLDKPSQAAILRGLFTADGTVANYGDKSQYVALDSTSEALLQQVQLLLLGFGIKAKIYKDRRALGEETAMLPDGQGGVKQYPVKQMHSLRISRDSRVTFEQQIGFFQESWKSRQLSELNESVSAYTDRMTDKVASVDFCGEADVYDLTEPISHHFVANGLVVHNCSEYMFLDNTACNLASVNVLKFFDSQTRHFDVDSYEHAIRLWTIVLEISVLMAQYPSKEIARLSHDFRTLGLGYANLGAMLMQAGIPYDSERARAISGCVSAILTGRSYATSAEMAAELGPFNGYYKNREPMHRVMRNHRRAAYGVPRDPSDANQHELGGYENLSIAPVPIDESRLTEGESHIGTVSNSAALSRAACFAWDDAVHKGEQYGYRNAQTTVIAPTGTIGLLMDCDTTGVEPDFALVKFKKLAGGGYFKIANTSVRPALHSLGYSDQQVEDILTYVLGTLHLDVPMPASDGSETAASEAQTFSEWLREQGFNEDDLQTLTDALPRIFELNNAFNPWMLGQALFDRLGHGAQTGDPNFNLLRALGLTKKQIAKLNEQICGTQTVEGAPHLKDEHLPVFDCAATCGPKGERYIAPEGHIRMMAAAQPFISGAISKTINLPNHASVDDIKGAYRLSWELGLKANALYRDGCKLSQPLSNSTDEADDEEGEAEEAELAAARSEVSEEVVEVAQHAGVSPEKVKEPVEKIVERIVERPLRRRLPDTRHSRTHKFNVAGHEGYLTVGLYEDGSPGELFITMAKEGSTIGGLMDSLGTAISVALQYGVPVESLVTKFTHQRFEPAGMSHNPDIPFAKSLVDYIFRWLGMEFVPGYREANAPKRSTPAKDSGQTSRLESSQKAREKARAVAVNEAAETDSAAATRGQSNGNGNGDGGGGDNGNGNGNGRGRIGGDTYGDRTVADRPADTGGNGATGESTGAASQGAEPGPAEAEAQTLTAAMKDMQSDAPACDVCGTITVRSGTCYKCMNCGNSMGCS